MEKNVTEEKTKTSTPEKVEPAKEPVARILPKLAPVRMKPAEFERQVYRIATPAGVTLEDCLEPAFWAHVADKLHPLDRIEVQPDDGSWYADLMVRSCTRLSAQVAVLNTVEFSEKGGEDVPKAGFEVKWSGPHTKFRVTRACDGAVVKDGFENREIANEFVANEMKSQA